MSSSPGIKPGLSNVWCPLLARHVPQLEQESPPSPEYHVPISVPDCGIMWHQPDEEEEEAFSSGQAAPDHYLQLMLMAGKRVQLARSKPQPTPGVALYRPEAAVPSAVKAAAAAPRQSHSLSISVHIVSVRFDPHALYPQLAVAWPLPLPVPVHVPAPVPVPANVPAPNSALSSATRAYSQRKFYLCYTQLHNWGM